MLLVFDDLDLLFPVGASAAATKRAEGSTELSRYGGEALLLLAGREQKFSAGGTADDF